MTVDAVPVARIDLAALVRNVRGASGDPVVALSHDAYGHGARRVADALLAQTDARLRVDDDPGLRALLSAHPRRVAAPDAVAADPGRIFGWQDGFAPVMTLIGTVLATKDLRAGEGVSYGYRHRAPHDTRIALVTGGYAQGVVRSLGGRASVALAGGAAPIVGRVAMDVCVVDIASHAVARGDEAVFFGAGGEPVSGWTRTTGLRESEIVAAVGAHTRREWVA
ncbi:alanine racemase C-terminal domain-containing protein [Microbacterium sp. NPDC089189]|uniref:alanine racemase n=1 Tax=Microbacterium sp. NPDC089189 TaxID=3154972 RepID=UPI003419FD32